MYINSRTITKAKRNKIVKPRSLPPAVIKWRYLVNDIL